MKDKKVVLQALLCFVLVVSLVLPAAVAGASSATARVTDYRSALFSMKDDQRSLSGEGYHQMSPETKGYSEPPPMAIDTSKQYVATVETAKGDVVLKLFARDAPVTVNNFVFLALEAFYDGLTFHRVIPGFVAQGGCPAGDGTGGPGYRFDDEFTEHTHVTGALSMANSGPNTNGSQFFITYAPQPHLDGRHTVFGQLIEGMDVLESIEQGEVMIRITIATLDYPEPPPMVVDTSKQYVATIETAKGDVVVELFAGDVPVTVNNFVFLALEGFYDGLTFHRVIPGFMAQGGCPVGDGTGGPGYRFDDEITEHTHGTGALSMANSGPNTNGSQFFITYVPQPHLDGKHTVFGQLTEGMDVLESLVNGDIMIRVTIDNDVEPPNDFVDNPPVEEGLASIADDLVIVLLWQPATQIWDLYFPLTGDDTIGTLEAGRAYFIYVDADCTLVYGTRVIELYAGWNNPAWMTQ